MPSGYVGNIITGSAVVVGAGLGWVATWTAGRRSRAERRSDIRREAYGTFIGAAEELTRLFSAYHTVESPPAPESTIGENVARYVGSVSRGYVAVLLAGPSQAKEPAARVRKEAWALLSSLRGYGRPRDLPADTLKELLAHIDAYIMACDTFIAFAEKTLDH